MIGVFFLFLIDEKGFTSTQLSVYDLDTPMKRTTTSAVPYSDTLATQVMVDGFVLSSCDYQGVSASFTRQFTANGQTLTHTDGRGNTTTTLLDIAGRTLLTRDAAGHETSMTYCENSNNVATVTDAMGNVVRYGYDHRGRKVSEFGTGIAPACFAYDDVDQLISLRTFRVTAGDVTTDPSLREDGDTTTWDYHAATGLLLTTTHADGTQELRTYNAFNQLASLTNARGHVAQHSYQLNTGDLTQISYNDESTPNQSFAYNHLGQITRLTDGAGTRQFTYNAYGEQEGDSVRVNSTDFKLVELRDEMGRSIGYNLMRGTSIMQSTSMSYDAQGRLSQAGFVHGGESKDFSYEYLAGTHFVQSLTHPNNIKWNYVYEAQRDLLTQINDTRGTTDVVLRTYTHDALGRPMTRRYARQGTVRNDNFAYNSRSELIGAQVAGDDFQYDYDNIGNRKISQETLQGVAESLTYDTNELNQYARVGVGSTVAQEDFTPSFDADGNQTLVKTSTGLWAVNYNAQNRPVRFTQGETTIECQYDSQGRRVFKKVSVAGAITLHHRYLYRGYVQIATIDMTRSGLNGLWMIFWDPSQPTATRPLAIQIAGTWFTYGLDLTKNVCELYKNNGGIATAYTYTPFGQATAVGTTTQPLGWSSEFMDGELDLVYYNYRHYNPQDGRWINRDPIGIQGGYNLYGFVGNKVSWIWDLLGRELAQVKKSVNVSLQSKIQGMPPTSWTSSSENPNNNNFSPYPLSPFYNSIKSLNYTTEITIDSFKITISGEMTPQDNSANLLMSSQYNTNIGTIIVSSKGTANLKNPDNIENTPSITLCSTHLQDITTKATIALSKGVFNNPMFNTEATINVESLMAKVSGSYSREKGLGLGFEITELYSNISIISTYSKQNTSVGWLYNIPMGSGNLYMGGSFDLKGQKKDSSFFAGYSWKF